MIIERLEPRTLFTAVLPFTFVQNGALLNITGNGNTASTATDQIQLTQSGGVITATDIRSGASISTTGTAITSIVVDLGNGNDYLRLRNNDGTKPVTVTVSTSLFGGAGNDTIYGGDGVDLIATGDGDDKLVGRGGKDTLDGGNGFDTADYSYETRAINVSLDGAPNDGVISIGEKDNVVCEAVVGGSGNDILIGNAASADWLDGGAGNDTIAGGGGNDTLTGGIGADTVFGQTGSDAAFIKDGTVDGTGDTLETAQIDSKNAGAAVNDIATPNVPVPVSQAAALAKFGAAIAAAVTVNPDGSANLSNPANLDNTFGVDFDSEYHGVSLLDPGGYDISVTNVLLQPYNEFESEFVDDNGTSTDKIIVVGTIYGYETSSYDFFVLRLNKDGTIDESFAGGDGIATADFTYAANNGSDTQDYATNATLDQEGNIFVVGYSEVSDSEAETTNTDVAIAKFTYDGYRDIYFGAADPFAEYGERLGEVLYDVPDTAGFRTSNDFGKAIVVDYEDYGSGLQNLITVAADVQPSAGGDKIAMLRFDLNGIPFSYDDPETGGEPEGFNNIQSVDGVDGYTTDMVEDGNGNFWLAVNRYNPDAPSTPGVVAFAHDGAFYDNFTTLNDPTGTLPLGGVANAIAINRDQLVVVGRTDAFDGFIATAQVDAAAILSDTSSVLPISPSGNPVSYNDVAFDAQDRIVATGLVDPYSNDSNMIVTRVNTDLSEDTTFNAGSASVEIDPADGKGDTANGILVQEDGAIVIAGTSAYSESAPTISVARLIGGDPVADETVDLTPTEAQNIFQWIPDPATDPTGTPRNIPLELFEHAIRESQTQVPLVINGTQEDDYISVTSTYDDAGNAVFRVNVNGAEDDWDRRFISEVDINTYGGNDVVRINDLLYNLPLNPNSFDADLLAVNITGQKNNLTVFVGSTPDGILGRSITELDENDPPLGTVVQPPDARLDDDPHTPLEDADGNDIPPDPVMIWEAGDNVGSTVLNYTETYPDFGYDYDASLNINLLDSNAPPLAGDDILSDVTENSAQVDIDPATLLVNDSAGPANESDQTLEITNVFDGEGGTVSLDTSGATPVIHFTPTPGYTGPASFTYEIKDGNVPADTSPHTALGTVTFNIVSANHAPTDLSLDLAVIPENSLPNTVVGGFTTTDPDSGDTFSYNLVSGSGDDDNNAFTISGDKLVAKNPFNFEGKNSYTVRVETSDGDKTFEKSFTIDVTNVNEAPSNVVLLTTSRPENEAVGTALSTIGGADPDAGDALTLSYSLVNIPSVPNDNSYFTITHSGNTYTLRNSQIFDYEAKPTYHISIRATDAGGLTFDKTVTLTVFNQNDPPTANAGGPYSVTLGSSIQLAGSGTDQDNSTLVYAWDLDGDGVFGETAISNSGGIANGDETGATPTFIGAGALGQHNIQLRVTDNNGSGLSTFSSTTVTVNPVVTSTKLFGTIFDSKGSSGNTPDKAFDGNPNTFFANTSSPMVEIDLGAAKTITGITYTPRNSFGSKMVGGKFQVSNSASFSTGVVTLYTITSAPTTGSVTTVNVSVPGTFRYFRYIGAAGTDGSVAEIGVYGSPGGGADHVAPSKPGTPHATGQTYTSISLAWDPSYDYFGVDHYDIYRGNTKIGSTSNLFFTDSGAIGGPLQAGKSYSYTVKAFDAAGNSATSAAASLKTLTDTVKPSQPANLHVVTGSLTKTSVTLAWNASTDDIAVVGYYIFRNGTKIGTTSSLNFTSTGLKTKTKYSYTVQAYDLAGNLSPLSAALSVTTL